MDKDHRYLRIALVVVGIAFLLIYPLMKIWPSGWLWQPGQYEYEQMIIGIYATLGVFLLWASRKPETHLSLIWFTVWSSVVHGLIMAVHAVIDSAERGHPRRCSSIDFGGNCPWFPSVTRSSVSA